MYAKGSTYGFPLVVLVLPRLVCLLIPVFIFMEFVS